MRIRTRTSVIAAGVAAIVGLVLATPADAVVASVRIAKHKSGPGDDVRSTHDVSRGRCHR